MRRAVLTLGLAGALAGPAAAQSPDPPAPADVPALLRAAEGTGAAATAAAEQLRGLDRATLAGAVDALERGCARARALVLAARRDRVRALARTVVAGAGRRVAALRREALAVIRGYEKPQQPEVDRLVNELRAIVYQSIPGPQLVTEAFRVAHTHYDLCCDLLDRAGAGAKAGPPLAPALVAQDREWMLKAWMKGGEMRVFDELEQHRDFLDPEEYRCIRAVNAYRALLGLPPDRVDRKLVRCGRKHAEEMVRLGYFSHTSPVKGRETYSARASQEGTSAASENIAAGQATGQGAFDGWYHSPGHHKNIIGSHSRTGVGRHGTTWTQLFG